MLSVEEIKFIKVNLSFWEKLNLSERDLIKNNIILVNYAQGETIYNPHECLGLLLIKTGELRVYLLSEDGREVTLYRLSKGETCILSASCLLKSITFDVHIKAETNTEAYLLDLHTFSKLSENIYVENFAYRNTVERFSDVMWAIEQILFMRFDKRLAIFLLDEVAKTKSLELALTQEQIAKYIGSAREVVSRMLKNFQDQGLVEVSRGLIRIANQNALRDLIG